MNGRISHLTPPVRLCSLLQVLSSHALSGTQHSGSSTSTPRQSTNLFAYFFASGYGKHRSGPVEETCTNSLEEAFDLFCRGVSPCGPFWDHVLDYWKEFKKNSERILFLRYEDMKEEPGVHLRRLAQFLGCPFLVVEEETGMVEEILKLCGFDNLSKLEINKTGKLANGVENKAFFRQGEVGDWKNLLPISMVKTIDQITEQKFGGVGLVL